MSHPNSQAELICIVPRGGLLVNCYLVPTDDIWQSAFLDKEGNNLDEMMDIYVGEANRDAALEQLIACLFDI